MGIFTIAIETDIFWCAEQEEIEFDGNKFILTPETDGNYKTVSTTYNNFSSGDQMHLCNERINRFLSALSWSKQRGILKLNGMAYGGEKPIPMGKPIIPTTCKKFNTDYLPNPIDENSIRALALYREALTVNSISYSFLGFYKIINLLFNSSAEQKRWINSNLCKITNENALQRVHEIKNYESDIGRYLYVQGRCAIAHAFSDPIVNPDLSTDIERLSKDIIVIQELAKIAISDDLNIKTLDKYYDEHLYELSGFSHVIGEDTLNRIKEGIFTSIESLTIPNISIRLRKEERLSSFENLQTENIFCTKNCIVLILNDYDHLLQVKLSLNFLKWRINFDPMVDVKIINSDCIKAIEHYSQFLLFTKKTYLNGEIEFYNSQTDKLLGRMDPFIPTNIDVRKTIISLEQQYDKCIEVLEK